MSGSYKGVLIFCISCWYLALSGGLLERLRISLISPCSPDNFLRRGKPQRVRQQSASQFYWPLIALLSQNFLWVEKEVDCECGKGLIEVRLKAASLSFCGIFLKVKGDSLAIGLRFFGRCLGEFLGLQQEKFKLSLEQIGSSSSLCKFLSLAYKFIAIALITIGK